MAEFRKECAFPTRLWKKDPVVEALRKEYRQQQAEAKSNLLPAVPPPTVKRRQLTPQQRSVSLERISVARRSRTGSVSRDSSRSGSRASQQGTSSVRLPSISITNSIFG